MGIYSIACPFLMLRSLYVYALSQSGSDWCYARIRKVATGEDYPETINWLKFSSLSFTHDNKGLFYQRFPEPVGISDAGTEIGLNGNAKVRQQTPNLPMFSCTTMSSGLNNLRISRSIRILKILTIISE